jgi:hypothetical protein
MVFAVVVAASGLLGCTSSEPDPPGADSGSGFQVPTDPYPPFPYVSAVQRRSFQAYLDCAQELGVRLDGPYADSKGHGALLRLQPGAAEPSASDRARVIRQCPQGVVAFAVTPGPSGSVKSFKRALRHFARCVSSHGAPHVPAPEFGIPDAYEGLVWPLDWAERSLVRAAVRCVGPLRDFTMER